MASQFVSERALHNVTEEADSQLDEIKSSQFTREATAMFREKIKEYEVELKSESVRLSKRHQADTVSAVDVKWASEHLISRASRRFFRHLGTLGGILLGISLQTTVTMTVSGQYSGVGTHISLIFGIVGVFLIALQIAKD